MSLITRKFKEIRKNRLAYFLILPATLCLAIVLFYPLFKVFYMSFFEIEPLYYKEPIFAGIKNFQKILSDSRFKGTLLQTAYWTFGSVALQFIIGLAAALIINEVFWGRGLARALLLVPWAMPAVVGAFSWKWMWHGEYGVVNHILKTLHLIPHNINWLGGISTAMAACIITNTWRGFPFMMIMLLAGLQNIPKELYDASSIDGASVGQELRYITLPLLKPVILVTTLLAGIWTFNNFAYIYILTGGGPGGKTDILVTFIYKQGFRFFHFGYAAALSVALFFMILAFSLLYIKIMRLESPFS